MRTLLLPLAVVALLALDGPSHAEFDSGGIAPSKAKATQATGAAFDASIAAQKGAIATEQDRLDREAQAIGFFPPGRRIVVWPIFTTNNRPPKQRGSNASNIPRPRRPANPPLSIDW